MNMINFQLLKRLTEAFGPSGSESEIKDLIVNDIRDHVSKLYTDSLGNLFAVKGNGGNLFICAHMDEVAFMITGYRSDGTLRFSQVGGITPKSLPSKRVYFPKLNRFGIIGAAPIHLNKNTKQELSYSDLYIDIGAFDKESAISLVPCGEVAVFDTKTEYFEQGGGIIMGKAIDDRLGCYLMCQLIKDPSIKNATFVFTVQEETGLIGAHCAPSCGNFDFGIALDVTTANDLPNISGPNTICKLRGGPVISFIDGRTLYDNEAVSEIFSVLSRLNIPCQTKAKRVGGNEAFSIQNAPSAPLSISVSVPCRYIHGPVGVLAQEDVLSTYNALIAMISHLQNKEESDA